jgi:hypothetical protein
MKQHNTVLPANRGAAPQANRQSLTNQLEQLKAHIKDNLVRAGRYAYAGKLDQAMRCHSVAADAIIRLKEVTDALSVLSFEAPVPDKTKDPRKAATKTVVKSKSYKRWSKK